MSNRSWLLLSVFIVVTLSAKPAWARVVISELFWAGSDLSTADEWIELFNSGSGGIIDISGWSLTSKNSSGEEVLMHRFATGSVIGSGQFLLISNYAEVESALSIQPDIVTTGVSLPNEKLQVRLYDASGNLIDTADDGIGPPAAGFNKTGSGIRASMERLSLEGSWEIPDHWASATTFIHFDSGSLLLGTPGLPLGSGLPAISLPRELSSSSSSMSSASGALSSAHSSSAQTSSTFSEHEIEVSPSLKQIFITEILANPKGADDEEWIEIGNFGTGGVLLEGWKLGVGTRLVALSGGTGTSLLLEPAQTRSFRKSLTGLPLRNGGDKVRLLSGSILVDEWSYPETAEEVSYGRTASGFGALQPFCVPTEGKRNEELPLPVTISVQSEGVTVDPQGALLGTGSLTLNLAAATASGSLTSAHCRFDFADGFSSDSCNPPVHKISAVGPGFVALTVDTYCSTTVTQVLNYFVYEKPKSGGKKSGKSVSSAPMLECPVSAVDGIRISEFLPDPFEDEAASEWIELRNETGSPIRMCGWQLDDNEEGSQPADLGTISVPANGYISVPRSASKLALNNPGDSVRLFAPGRADPIQTVSFLKAIEGESYALREDGYFVWTPFLTPGLPNRFRTAERSFPTDRVVVAAALPNPVGPDEKGEWTELQNVSDAAVTLDGWELDNKPGGSPPFPLSGRLTPGQVRRFLITETKVSLVNSVDQVRLLDPDGYVASTFGWTEAVEGRIYRRPVIVTERAKAKVVNVIDGDTIDIALIDPDQLDRLPSSLKRRWLAQEDRKNEAIRVRLIGIDTPETVHPSKPVQAYGKQASDFTKSLLQGAAIELAFDEEIWDKYDRLLAYAYLADGESIQAKLLQAGLAFAYLRFPFLFREEFIAYEREAQSAKLGLWADPEAAQYAVEQQEYALAEAEIEQDGLGVAAEPKPGLVTSGTVVRFTPTVPADLFLSVESGAWLRFSGTYIVGNDVNLAVYAERVSGSGVIQSGILEVSYALQRDHYNLEAIISEVSPSPAKGELEWVELYNPTDREISLAGWKLDDVLDAGSQTHQISPAFRITPGGYLVLTKEQTELAFNNDGDYVWLTAPDDSAMTGFSFGKIKTGKTVTPECITDVPTPGEPNVCVTFLAAKEATDSDRDFLADDRETWLHHSNPANPDTDGDGWLDGFEAAVGENPVTATGSLRGLREEYRDFLIKKVKPTWHLYKQKGLIVKGKAYPTARVTALVAGQRGEADIKADGSFKLFIPPPLAAGMHHIDLQIEDSVGRVIQEQLSVALESDYVIAPTKKSRARALLGAIKQRFRNVVFGTDLNSEIRSELLPELAELRNLTSLASVKAKRAFSPAVETGFIILIFSSGLALILGKNGWLDLKRKIR